MARRFIILCHRYLGIPMSLLFVVWFVSGIVMMYAGGMPALTPDLRLARLPALELERIELSAAEAAERAGVGDAQESVKLTSVLGRPAYRFTEFPGFTVTVFADSGETLRELGFADARRAAVAFSGASPETVSFVQTVQQADQWTLTQQGNLPLHQYAVDDGAGTNVYVSARSGEVTLVTDRRSRMLAWLGTIPHWFYFTPLRVNQPLWYSTVVWASALGCLLAALGLVLAFTQFRRSRPFSLAASIRYRGWMRWHYLTGAIFGVFALTWVFSGLMSMEPFAWTNETGLQIDADVFSGGPIEIRDYGDLDAARWKALLGEHGLKEVEFLRIGGRPYFAAATATQDPAAERERLHQPYLLRMPADDGQLLIDAESLTVRHTPFAPESLLTRLEKSMSTAAIAEHELLDDYDSYYYSRTGQAPLPVLRVKFDDPDDTWYYIDPVKSEVVARTHRYSRLERWLFTGLHSLDFSFWYDKRPLWDIGMILLSIGALATSLIGMCLGIKRLGSSR